MKKTLILAIVASVMWISSAEVRAVNYYVDATGGNDGNPGTEALPWLTLKKAGDTAAAGDTVFIKGGVYKAPLFPKNSGTLGNYISFKGVQGDNVIIEGGYEVTGWTVHSGSIYSASWESSWMNADWVNISGLKGFVNVDYKLDAGHWPKPTPNLGEMTSGSWYYDNGSKKLYLWLKDSSNPNDHAILAAKSWYYSAIGILINGKRYLRFENIEIRLCHSGVYIDPEGSQDIFLNNIEAYGVHTGVRNLKENSNIFMTGIDIHHTIGPGIQNNGSNCTITESKIHETGMVEWQRWGNVGVILMGSYNTLKDSEIYNTGYNSTYGPGVVFETWGTYGEGGEDTSHDNVVENCVIYNSPKFYAIVFYGSDNCIARRNIIYNMKGGIRVQKGGDAGEMTQEQKVTNDNKIFNNSIINCSEFGIKITDNCLNTEFYNNIFYQVDTPLIFFESVKNSIKSSHNNFYSDGGFRIVYGNTTYTSLTDYSQATGKDQNSLYADPLFNNPTNSDFYLKSNSPCIDAGTDVGLTHDFAWNTIPHGLGPDIGAFEFTGIACLTIDQTGWSLVYVDSEELVEDGGYPAEKSFDGDPDTFWSTKWSLPDPEFYHPHEIQIDLGGFYDICGFRYLPRQDGSENGMIDDYEFYVSNNTDDWGTAVASGTLTKDKTEKQVSFDRTLGQYVRLVALSEVNDNPWTTMAELNVLAVQPDTDINNDGKVNIEDFAALAIWWDDENTCSPPDWCGGADFDMSGTVDMLDFTYFAENWLRQAE